MQLAKTPRIDLGGRAHQQVLRLLVYREGDDLANIGSSASSITIRSIPGVSSASST